jgi:hypothetical protein
MIDDEKMKTLMALMKYSDEDLRLNRKGILSNGQKQLIGNNAWISSLVFVLAGLFFSGMMIFMVKQPLTVNSIIIFGTPGGIFIIFGIFLFWHQRRDYEGGIVKCAVGVIRISPSKIGYALCVDEVQLPILYNIQTLIDENIIYKVYYTPADRHIVSLEKM